MTETSQPGWTRVLTRTGRYEYQFQGRVPSVRNGHYEDASDYQFLVMDEEGWLYRIPVRLAAAAEVALQKNVEVNKTASPSTHERDGERPGPARAPTSRKPAATPTEVAAAQLRVGLDRFRPRQNAPYAELDTYFAVDAARAQELAEGTV